MKFEITYIINGQQGKCTHEAENSHMAAIELYKAFEKHNPKVVDVKEIKADSEGLTTKQRNSVKKIAELAKERNELTEFFEENESRHDCGMSSYEWKQEEKRLERLERTIERHEVRLKGISETVYYNTIGESLYGLCFSFENWVADMEYKN